MLKYIRTYWLKIILLVVGLLIFRVINIRWADFTVHQSNEYSNDDLVSKTTTRMFDSNGHKNQLTERSSDTERSSNMTRSHVNPIVTVQRASDAANEYVERDKTYTTKLFDFPHKDDVESPSSNKPSPIMRYIIKGESNPTQKVHIATAASDEYLPGVIGLIKSAYRTSRYPHLIQFEIFLTPDQSASEIENLKQSKESQERNWSIRLHRFTEDEVDKYVNHRFNRYKYKVSAHKTIDVRKDIKQNAPHKRGKLKTSHNWVRYILYKRLPDVDYCFWVDADICMHKDIVQFAIEETRTPPEKLDLLEVLMKNWIEKAPVEYDLYGPTFQTKYPLAAFSSYTSGGFRSFVYYKLKKNNFEVQGMPHFNAGCLLFNLKLWREQKINRQMVRLAKFNDEYVLWTDIGSQGPLNLVLGGKKFFPIPEETMQLTLGYQTIETPNEEVYFLHWNGVHKPWMEKGLNKHLWPA